jgi:hypothetical protein
LFKIANIRGRKLPVASCFPNFKSADISVKIKLNVY